MDSPFSAVVCGVNGFCALDKKIINAILIKWMISRRIVKSACVGFIVAKKKFVTGFSVQKHISKAWMMNRNGIGNTGIQSGLFVSIRIAPGPGITKPKSW